MWHTRINTALKEQKKRDRYRQQSVCTTNSSSVSIQVDQNHYFNFSSNDYLGLAHHPQMIASAVDSAKALGVGSGGSPHVTGYSASLSGLEAKLASWLGYEAAIVYPSGFTANQAVIKLMIEQNDLMIADRLSHASLLEAAVFSKGRLFRFKHNDCQSLKSYLDKPLPENAGRLVITEGVFSMDGDHAPLKEIKALTDQYDHTLLMIDDAHGIGIFGEGGRGSCDLYGIKPDILVVTFGKAFGCSGAALLLSEELKAYFIQFSKPLIYSTAISPMQAAILDRGIDLIASKEGDQKRAKLKENITYFRAKVESLLQEVAQKDSNMTLPYLLASQSPIQPLIIGSDQAALEISKKLRDNGIWVSAIRPPTVPPNTARLRITITAEHSLIMIDTLILALQNAIYEQFLG
ncbi:8-amino-7-oxononanoate synthase [Ignatzschineria rhizosphaerae]|uniref:8-amino-7-oxononanoate synthase n=1 Tax=Ignatzschineria rhizosphaerae TaxID=2923279 RepID=A0ABY3X5M3_9GAMM|nr:8-amino-7-oxononanoate synthase [Ignatzschineria rhizosphaerae]UNM97195.1 8-amino-7-oxononanoate synthase [Ignatzschineria rhizosphaerae]